MKTTFSFESYLDVLSFELRPLFTKMRISSHDLRIETGRYTQGRIARDERYCLVCGSRDIEDEYHFIVICPSYSTLRKKYINKKYYTRASMIKFIDLLNRTDKSTLTRLCLYIKYASIERKRLPSMWFSCICLFCTFFLHQLILKWFSCLIR